MEFLFKHFLSPPTLSLIIGGMVVAIFGYKTSRAEDQKTPRWIAVGTLIGGVLVLCGGIWSGVNESKNIELLQKRSNQIFTLSSQNVILSNKIDDLSEQNVDLSKELMAYTTGGDSHCYIFPMFDEVSQWLTMMLFHEGKYPLYDVELQIDDITGKARLHLKELYAEIIESHKEDDKIGRERQRDLMGEVNKLLSQTKVVKNIGTFLPNTGLEVLRIPWPKGDIQEYIIRIYARNSYITQNIKAKKSQGAWKYSYRVSKQAQGKSVIVKEFLTPEVDLPKN